MRSELVLSHTDDMHFFDCMHQLCGMIVNWSDQPYADSKLQCHCECKDSRTDAYIIHHIEYNMVVYLGFLNIHILCAGGD